jgi:hypothetical protein
MLGEPCQPCRTDCLTGTGPGAVIFVTLLGFYLFDDGLRDAFDPRLKSWPRTLGARASRYFLNVNAPASSRAWAMVAPSARRAYS